MISRSTDIKSALRSRQRGFLLNPFRFGGGGGSDPDWASVVRLLHMDGADGGAAFTDSSSLAVAVTNIGSATTSAYKKQYGATSAALTGTNYLTTLSPVFLLSEWTIELSFYMDVAPAGERRLLTVGGVNSNYSDVRIWVDSTQKVTFWINFGGGTFYLYLHATALDTGVWHSLAFVRATTTSVMAYINGTRVWNRGTPATSLPDTGAMYIGSGSGEASHFNGYIDEVRVTKAARYIGASYELPIAAFPDA